MLESFLSSLFFAFVADPILIFLFGNGRTFCCLPYLFPPTVLLFFSVLSFCLPPFFPLDKTFLQGIDVYSFPYRLLFSNDEFPATSIPSPPSCILPLIPSSSFPTATTHLWRAVVLPLTPLRQFLLIWGSLWSSSVLSFFSFRT